MFTELLKLAALKVMAAATKRIAARSMPAPTFAEMFDAHPHCFGIARPDGSRVWRCKAGDVVKHGEAPDMYALNLEFASQLAHARRLSCQ
jgi:hypothetical protein